jgi:lysylphosphatidylglycerol synthetase-like protein (DUF2156 family)
MSIVKLQEIDGSWTDAGAVSGAAHVTFVKPADASDAVFATLLALAILRKKASEKKASWGLVEEKALGWLASKGVTDAESQIAAIAASLSETSPSPPTGGRWE